MGWADWMVVEQSLEEELRLERTVRAIYESDDLKQLQDLCAALTKQQWHYAQLLKQAVGHIAELDAIEACRD
jgi:hypothetical protein